MTASVGIAFTLEWKTRRILKEITARAARLQAERDALLTVLEHVFHVTADLKWTAEKELTLEVIRPGQQVERFH